MLALGLLAAGWFPQDRLRLLVERRMQEAIGPRSRIGALHVVPGTLSAEVRELTLEGPAYRIEVPHARVRASLALVIRGALDLHSLEADSARITIRPAPRDRTAVRANGRPHRVAAPRPTPSSSTKTTALGGSLRLDDVDASGSIGSGALVATAAGGVWAREPEVPLGPASLRARVSPIVRARRGVARGGHRPVPPARLGPHPDGGRRVRWI